MTTEGTWTLICQIGLLESNMGGRYCVNTAVLVCVCVCVCVRVRACVRDRLCSYYRQNNIRKMPASGYNPGPECH